MMDQVRKGLLISLGAAFLAKQEVKRQVKLLVEAGKITASQGKKLSDKFLKEGMKQHTLMRKLIDSELERIAKAGKSPPKRKTVKRKR